MAVVLAEPDRAIRPAHHAVRISDLRGGCGTAVTAEAFDTRAGERLQRRMLCVHECEGGYAKHDRDRTGYEAHGPSVQVSASASTPETGNVQSAAAAVLPSGNESAAGGVGGASCLWAG